MKHLVLIRLLYEDEKEFEYRYKLFQETALKCLKEQTDKNFEIGVFCHRKHIDKIKELGLNPITFKEGINFDKYCTTFFQLSARQEELDNVIEYDIQTRLDSDDIVSKDYIKRIHQEIEKANKDEIIVIHFQPQKLNYETKETLSLPEYTSSFVSMFVSLYQPKGSNYRFILHDWDHAGLGKLAQNIIKIEEGYCFLNVHGRNNSTKM